MKSVSKAYRVPEPLAEALRLVAFDKRISQTEYVLDAVANKLLMENDTRINAFVADYMQHREELLHTDNQ